MERAMGIAHTCEAWEVRCRCRRSGNVVELATNLRKSRKEGEQKGEKRLGGFCYKLLLFRGLRRLRQDLVNLLSHLEGRRSIQLSYGRLIHSNGFPVPSTTRLIRVVTG